ncbi:Clp1/GlmU family protein [Indioceanicola profundi]|uniref:Clp1/GlmU family protein n=1 Tax=Indioceanicola profundi TaxID=2220096 RepID=UPI000E6A951F|nr:Clp1/GlmU family protein [Indioceanicola profundi]
MDASLAAPLPTDAETGVIDVPPDWEQALDRASFPDTARLLILGPTDMGKSTFCRLALRHAEAAGRRPTLVDADPGQKTVGPPACITAGRLDADDELRLTELAFVGTTDPLRAWGRVVAGTRHLVERAASQGDLVLINTVGFLRGPGRRLMAALIQAVQPTLLVTIGRDQGIEDVLADHPHIRHLRLAPSPLARRKTQGDRRRARQLAFGRHFRGAASLILPLGRITMEGASPGATPPPGLLIGLTDGRNRDVGIGIVEEAYPEKGFVQVLTTAPARLIRAFRWGSLALDAAFRDMRRTEEASA